MGTWKSVIHLPQGSCCYMAQIDCYFYLEALVSVVRPQILQEKSDICIILEFKSLEF